MDNTIKVNDVVKFLHPDSIEESVLRMIVLEDNGNRVLVETNLNWPYNPQETFLKKDLIKA